MPNYKQGKIYCIRSHQTEQIYIGSTTQTLAVRFAGHRRSNDCKSKQILQYQDAYIELIELFPCDTKEELNRKEGEHIRKNNCVNKHIAGRTPKEYQDEHKEHKKQYREQNIERYAEYGKQYYQKNKERILEQKKQRLTKKNSDPI